MTSINYKLVPVVADFSYDTGHATVEEGYVDCAQGALDALLSWPMGDAKPNGRKIDQYNATAVQKLFALFADLQLLRYGIANDLDQITLTDGDIVKQVDMGQYIFETFNDFEEHLSGVVNVETNSDSGTWSVFLAATPPGDEDWVISYRGGTYYLDTETTANRSVSSNLDALIVETMFVVMDVEGYWPNLYVTSNGEDFQQVIDFSIEDPQS